MAALSVHTSSAARLCMSAMAAAVSALGSAAGAHASESAADGLAAGASEFSLASWVASRKSGKGTSAMLGSAAGAGVSWAGSRCAASSAGAARGSAAEPALVDGGSSAPSTLMLNCWGTCRAFARSVSPSVLYTSSVWHQIATTTRIILRPGHTTSKGRADLHSPSFRKAPQPPIDASWHRATCQGRRTRLGMMIVSSPLVSLAWMPSSLASLLRGTLMSTALRGLAARAACKREHCASALTNSRGLQAET